MKENSEQPFVESTPRRSGAGTTAVVIIVVLVVGFFCVVLVGGTALLFAKTSYQKEAIMRDQAMLEMKTIAEAQRSRMVMETAREAIFRDVTISMDGNGKLKYDGTAIEQSELLARLNDDRNSHDGLNVKLIVPGETKQSRVSELMNICRAVTSDVVVNVAPASPKSKARFVIAADGTIKKDDTEIAREDLATELAKIANPQQTSILLEANADLPLDDVVKILNECKQVCDDVEISVTR